MVLSGADGNGVYLLLGEILVMPVGVHQRCIVLFTLEGIDCDGGIGNRIDDELQKIGKTLILVSVILLLGYYI